MYLSVLLKGCQKKGITAPAASDNSFAPKRTCIHNSKTAVKFEVNCLKQDKVSFTHRDW